MSQKESEWKDEWKNLIMSFGKRSLDGVKVDVDKESLDFIQKTIDRERLEQATADMELTRELLAQREKEIAEEVEKKKQARTSTDSQGTFFQKEGYNVALDEVLSIIKH